MTRPSLRTLGFFYVATLLIVIPLAYLSGERGYCETTERRAVNKAASANPEEVPFDDVCTMIDFGMTNAVHYSFLGGIVLIIVAAASYGRDRKKSA
jgi:hypothetical protein